jgi:hypothetical protein
MPRLRRIKDYEWVDNGNFHVEDSDDESTESSGSQPLSEATTGQSWLSNASVIASLNDEKLKSSINYYRTLAKLMEEELVGRRMGTRSQRHICPPGGFDSSGQNRSSRGQTSRTAKRITKLVTAIAKGLDAGLSLDEIYNLLTKERE